LRDYNWCLSTEHLKRRLLLSKLKIKIHPTGSYLLLGD
jgi:hypothetical protein